MLKFGNKPGDTFLRTNPELLITIPSWQLHGSIGKLQQKRTLIPLCDQFSETDNNNNYCTGSCLGNSDRRNNKETSKPCLGKCLMALKGQNFNHSWRTKLLGLPTFNKRWSHLFLFRKMPSEFSSVMSRWRYFLQLMQKKRHVIVINESEMEIRLLSPNADISAWNCTLKHHTWTQHG